MWRQLYLRYRLAESKSSLAECKLDPGRCRQWLDKPLAEVNLLALDIETTGLDPLQDQIVSLGWLPLRAKHIFPAEAQQHYVKIDGSVGQSAVYHKLRDCELQQQPELSHVLLKLLALLEHSVLLVHHAALDVRFLQQAIKQLYTCKLPLAYIDTQQLAWRFTREKIDENGFRLEDCRRKYQLPVYGQHSAITDALACAELFCAQASAYKLWQQPLASVLQMR